MNDIQEGEEKLRAEINKNLMEYKTKVELLQIQLNFDVKSNQSLEMSTSILDECRYYKQLYFKLVDIKKERKNKYDSLMNKQNELCKLLDERPYEFNSSGNIKLLFLFV